MSFLTNKGKDSYLPFLSTSQVTTVNNKEFMERKISGILRYVIYWVERVCGQFHFNICDCLEWFNIDPGRDGSFKASDLVETLTWGGVEDTAGRWGERAHVRCGRVAICSCRNGGGGCCGAIGAARAVGRGGAAAVAAAWTDTARLCTLVIVLRPLATAVLDTHSQLTCVGVEAGRAAWWSAAAKRALNLSTLAA